VDVPRIAIIVQARMTSTRLPGKVLAPVLGRPLLEYELERLHRVQTPHLLVVATTTNPADDPIVHVAETMGCAVFRGSEADVLGRYAGAARSVEARVVVRITADCPLIDSEVTDLVIGRFLDGGCDYASNTLERTFPRGLDVEVFSRDVLDIADREASDAAEREHVTLFIYRHPERFALANVRSTVDLSRYRWTVDAEEDLELVRRLIGLLYPHRPTFGLADALDLMDRHPDLAAINRHVAQKATEHNHASP
jgi:spore coat polysaccharide biosynthesis protein SpsF